MRATVVIPAYNAASTIADCLGAVLNQSRTRSEYEVIVVDDGSDDTTGDLAQSLGAKVICQRHMGAATARNTGLQCALGEIVCFTDADCFPAQDWLNELIAPFADPEIIGCKGIYATKQRKIVARFVQLEYEDKYDLLCGQDQIDFVDTYCAAYRREVLLANGGFDERFQFVEDQELSFRLAARGYKMVFQPSAVVYHHHSDSLLSYIRKKMAIGFWKAQVVRRFPSRGLRDSHTPQIMKLQMGIMALISVSLLLSAFTRLLFIPLLILVLGFLATTAPFVIKTWPKDWVVSLAAPLLLAVRALSLGSGYGWGLIRPRKGISGTQSTIGGLNYICKRAIDIAGSSLGLLFALSVGPIIALAIKVNSPGPIFFRQRRVGQGGKVFTMVKFRSMFTDAERELDSLVDLETLEEPAFKLARDPRVTRVGHVLRRWSLDELPQFWNVFRGEMSLVGPRPEETRVVALYGDWHRRRLSVRPGMTGPMQVSGRGDLTLDARVRLELEYIERYSVWRDLVILARTVPAILRGNGAR